MQSFLNTFLFQSQNVPQEQASLLYLVFPTAWEIFLTAVMLTLDCAVGVVMIGVSLLRLLALDRNTKIL